MWRKSKIKYSGKVLKGDQSRVTDMLSVLQAHKNFFLADFMSQILQFLSAKVTTVNSVKYYKPVTSVLTVCLISVKAGRHCTEYCMYVQY